MRDGTQRLQLCRHREKGAKSRFMVFLLTTIIIRPVMRDAGAHLKIKRTVVVQCSVGQPIDRSFGRGLFVAP